MGGNVESLTRLHFYFPSHSSVPLVQFRRLLPKETHPASAKKGLHCQSAPGKVTDVEEKQQKYEPIWTLEQSCRKVQNSGREVFFPHLLLCPLYDDGEVVENAKMLF